MKKAFLPLLISSLLVGCGSGSNSDSTSDTPLPNSVTALFMDSAAVMGVDYNCDNNERGTTSELGEFTVTEGAICDFSLDGYFIGSNKAGITSKNHQITAYALSAKSVTKTATKSSVPTSKQYVANISALLQSIDVNQADNKIDTTDVVGESLTTSAPLMAIDDAAFATAIQGVKVVINQAEDSIPTGNIKVPSQATDELNDQYTSENISQIVSDLKDVLAGDITAVDIEAKLNEYRTLIEKDDSSNGYHQKALAAILEIAEIANMEEVATRVDITNTNYSEMLAKAISYSFGQGAVIELVETPTGTTEDVSKVLIEAANRLVNASEKLAAAMPGESYVLPYSLDSEDKSSVVTYQDSLVIRTAALSAASALYTASAYNAGDDTDYLPQSQTFTDVAVVEERTTWDGTLTRTWNETDKNIDAEFANYSYDPRSYYQSSSLFSYRLNATELLVSAKSALINAVVVSKFVNLSSYIDEEEVTDVERLISDLDRHLSDESSFMSIQDDEDTTYVNLHAFYNTSEGIDRSDLDIVTSEYECDTSNLDGDATYSVQLSQIFSEPTCSYNGSYTETDSSEEEYTKWSVIKELSYRNEGNTSIWTFIPVIDADFEVTITESSNSTLLDVMWCGINKDTEEKVSCIEE